MGWLILILLSYSVSVTFWGRVKSKEADLAEIELKTEVKSHKKTRKLYATLRRDYEEIIEKLPADTVTINDALDKLRKHSENSRD